MPESPAPMISTSTWSEVIGGLYVRVHLGVKLLPRLEHLDELREPPRPRLGPLGVLQAIEDRVAVLAVQAGEERLRPRSRVELAPEVVGDGHRRLPGVGRRPAAVGLRGLGLGQAARAHPALGDQPLGLLAVDLRPLAARRARAEALQEPLLVQRLAPAVDPPEADR